MVAELLKLTDPTGVHVFLALHRYVNEKDLAFFKYHALEDGPCEGASAWEKMMDKDVPGFVKYTSWRRTLPSGKTEYKSVTISPNATAREFSDLYLDDDFRCVPAHYILFAKLKACMHRLPAKQQCSVLV